MSPEDKEWFISYLSEGMHTAFRKASGHMNASRIHALIQDLPSAEWASIVLFVSTAMIDGLDYRAKKSELPAPGLAPWKVLDLSKAIKHDHPDIEVDKPYLVKVHGGWFFGPFTRQWYGLNFTNWGFSGRQFDAPGYNSSTWEAVIEIDAEAMLGG